VIAVDAGFLFALVDRRDAWHERATALTPTASDGWITTWPVLAETAHMMMRWLGVEYACALMDDVASGGVSIWEPADAQVARVAPLMRQYAKLPMDLADATLVLLAEHLGHGRILSTDERDFRTYRWKRRKPFLNLLAD